MMNNILKVALIGGGAYLAYNYLQKRKNNISVATTSGSGASDVLVAESEEEGESTLNASGALGLNTSCPINQTWCYPTASCVSTLNGQYPQNCSGKAGISKRKSIKRGVSKRNVSMSSADGWDSDTISSGL